MFQQALRLNPDFADALLELANLRIASKKFPEAADLLRRYVKVSRNPATGYYKLAMVERSLHETAAADRDLKRIPNALQKCFRRSISVTSIFSTIWIIAPSLLPRPAINWISRETHRRAQQVTPISQKVCTCWPRLI